jgi:surfeit locus 1 family protein
LPQRFAPRWYFTLLTLLALPLFVSLGLWQWHRGQHRSQEWASFARGDIPAVEASAQGLQQLPRYTRVRVRGEYDAARQFLIENLSHDGQPGYEVLTVLRLGDGSQLLVNRGWLPFSGYRDHLPDIAMPATGSLTLTGRLGDLPVPGLAAGRQAPAADGPWPRVTTFPTHADLVGARGESLLAPVLLLDADSGPGYLRQWQAPGLSPERHFGYAVQWWAFGALAIGLYVGLNLKRVR